MMCPRCHGTRRDLYTGDLCWVCWGLEPSCCDGPVGEPDEDPTDPMKQTGSKRMNDSNEHNSDNGSLIKSALNNKFLAWPGAWFLIDGQFGSTGKGVIAALLGDMFGNRADVVTTNAGPNSGHTSYIDGEKVVLKQIPTFAAAAYASYFPGEEPIVYLNGGAVIDPNVLRNEYQNHIPGMSLVVNPFAARIGQIERDQDKKTVESIASTGQGVGPAIVNKTMRNYHAVMEAEGYDLNWYLNAMKIYQSRRIFCEIAQGYSLGLNAGFYPYTTSRNCTVTQAMADADIPPTMFQGSILTVRTYPIRVGNVGDASSGPCYSDQYETTWGAIGVPPEYTTVTGRERRVFTWSRIQFRESVRINRPTVVFLNFCNYLSESDLNERLVTVVEDYWAEMGQDPIVLLGLGPSSEDVRLLT